MLALPTYPVFKSKKPRSYLKDWASEVHDSVIYTSAEYFNIDVIITRDKKGFKQSNIKVMEPNDFLEEYKLY